MGLKTNVTGYPNITIDNNLNDTSLDSNFAINLESLIKGFTSSGVYKITILNDQSNPAFSVTYTVSTTTSNPTPADAQLADYINNTANTAFTTGKMNINTGTKKISFTPKDPNQNNTSSKTGSTSGSTGSTMFSSASGHTMDDKDILNKVSSMIYKQAGDTITSLSGATGTTTTTTTTKGVQKESILNNKLLQEQIIRMKKIMNYGI